MQSVLAILIGLGLAAACGLRVFVPMLALSVAARLGAVTLSTKMGWIGSDPALIALSVATLVEIIAYKTPWLDHWLDVLASPMAVVAGTMVAASQMGTLQSLDPLLLWGGALIAGGGAAAAMQTTTVSTRAASTVATAGLANPIISLGQTIASVVLSVLAILVPIVAAIVLVLALVGGLMLIRFVRGSKRMPKAG